MTNDCVHVLSGRKDIFSGLYSTMQRERDKGGTFIERCKICGHTESYQRAEKFRKVISNSADGFRRDQLHNHWKDVLQPVNKDGRENKLYTETYGYNPISENPEKRAPKEQNVEADADIALSKKEPISGPVTGS